MRTAVQEALDKAREAVEQLQGTLANEPNFESNQEVAFAWESVVSIEEHLVFTDYLLKEDK